MVEDRMVWLNGDFIPWEKATVHIMSHSFGRGSAIFEVISAHETADGAAVRLSLDSKRILIVFIGRLSCWTWRCRTQKKHCVMPLLAP